LVAVEIILIFAGEVTLFGSIYILSKSISINKTFLLVKPLFFGWQKPLEDPTHPLLRDVCFYL
jgi:hypothetical protein